LTNAGFNINILNAKNHTKEAEIIANAGRFSSITVVTNMAGRGTDIKLGGDPKIILKRRTYGWDDEGQIEAEAVLIAEEVSANKQKVIEAGGLYILGAEHNNSRRIDDQLRGRAGRQGDPGESKFFESTDGELFRKFNPNMTSTLLRFGAQEDEVLTHPLLTGAINNAQQRMEAYNFETRQSMQKYADIKETYIMRFYEARKKILESDNIAQILIRNFEEILVDPKALQTLAQECGYKGDGLEEWARKDFYTALEGMDEEMLHRALLDAFDENIKRYMIIMSNERDIVALHSYSQKDPITAYYKIARTKSDLVHKMIRIDSIANIIYSASDKFDMDELDSALNELQQKLNALRLMEGTDAELVSEDVEAISEALVGENGEVAEPVESERPEVATPASTPDDSKYPEEVKVNTQEDVRNEENTKK